MRRIRILLALSVGVTAVHGPAVGADPVQTAALSRPGDPSAERPARVHLPPTTGPRQLPPVDPAVLPPPEERWTSPEEQAQHRRIMDELWATKLGQMYLSFLTEQMPAVSVPARANQIIELILSDADEASSRIRALQLLTQDVYAREQMTEDVTRRVVLWDQILQAKVSKGDQNLKKRIVNEMLGTFLASLPFGFEGFRTEARNLYDYTANRIMCRRECEQINVDLKRLLNRKNHGPFRITKSFSITLAFFGAISMFQFAWSEWKPGWMADAKTDKDMLNGRDVLLEDANF